MYEHALCNIFIQSYQSIESLEILIFKFFLREKKLVLINSNYSRHC